MRQGGDRDNQVATPLLGANLPHSLIYKHQLPQKKEEKKGGCLLSINRNHSPMVLLIMRPHTELRGWRCSPLFGPASFKLQFLDPPPYQPQPADCRRAEGWRRKVQTLGLQQVCWMNKQLDAADQRGAWARFTHQQREISKTSQWEDYCREARFFFLTWTITQISLQLLNNST